VNFFKFFLIVTIATVFNLKSISWADVSSARPDGHAPIGVMGEHTHKAGEWMLSYRYRNMFMSETGLAQVLSVNRGFYLSLWSRLRA